MTSPVKSVERRREMILSLIATTPIATQEELVSGLKARGVEASQASVSRDIAALGLIKSGGRYARPRLQEPTGDPLADRVRGHVLSIKAAGGNLLVLGTPPGEAPGVALALDRMGLEGVVGTLAGDDTIFVAADGAAGQAAAVRALERLLAEGE